MLEQLKGLAMQKLMEKMSGNSLNAEATNEAASEGVGALLETLKGGDISQLTGLLGGGGAAAGGVMEMLQGKLGDILQAKGMDATEAKTEAAATAGDLVSGLKDKFASAAPEDSAFDISQLTGLLSGGAGGLLGGAGDLLNKAKGAGDMLNAAKGLFGK